MGAGRSNYVLYVPHTPRTIGSGNNQAAKLGLASQAGQNYTGPDILMSLNIWFVVWILICSATWIWYLMRG